jgi:allene oxide cyclase
MKRIVAVSAAGVAVVVSVAAWSAQSNAQGRKADMTFDLAQTAEHVVDEAPAGDSAGDTAVLAGDLLQGGKKAGQYQGYCVYITSGANSQCSFTLALADGQIVLSVGYGSFNGDTPPSLDPIVGGSGAYSKARGYAEGTENDEGGTRYVLHVGK